MTVSWLTHALLPQGRLGLTHSPGAGQRSRDEDLVALALQGVSHIVCLQEPFEFDFIEPGETLEDRHRAVSAHGMAFTHSAIRDMRAPDLDQARQVVDIVLADLHREMTIVVHCYAGLGRAGTIAACTLVAAGAHPLEAIKFVRRSRPGAIQSPEQESFVERFIGARDPAPGRHDTNDER